MRFPLRRTAASLPVRARSARAAFTIFLTLLFAASAHAVVLRGRVTDALGKPVPGARVQLIEAGKVAASTHAGEDGTYELRSPEAGRFTLLTSGVGFLPTTGQDFYGGAMEVLSQNIVLAANTVNQEVSVTATGVPTPLPQLTAPVTVIPGEAFTMRLGVLEEIRQSPGVFVVQSGQTGGVTSLFLRGGNSTANLVLVDGIPAEDVGGTFDYGTVSSTGVGRMEIYRGPDSAIYGTDAGAGVITIETPRGATAKPLLTYSGDGGNLHTWRNEATLGGTWQKLDYFAGASRLDTSNALPRDRYHDATSAGNVGYAFGDATAVRFTIRNSDSVEGLPNAHDFYGISADAHEADQDLYSGLTLEHHFPKDLHTVVRYGIARKREQARFFSDVGTKETFYAGTPYEFYEYYGAAVTIRGANGYTASGRGAFLNMAGNHYDQDSNRDQLYFQTGWSPSLHFNALFGFRYDKERGSFNQQTFFDGLPNAPSHELTQRTNFEYNLQFQGEYWGRFDYSLGAAVEKNHLYGIAGTPRLGLAYSLVRPGPGLFHGTRIRANAASGVQEPTLALESFSLYQTLLKYAPADVPLYHVTPAGAERSRTYDIGVDQDLFGEKLVLKAGYFHNTFDHQLESVSGTSLATYFGINDPALTYTTQYLNSQAYRAQGEEVELDWQALRRVMVRGGYTHLDARVLQSFSTDAVDANQGSPNQNPNLPGVPIGFEGPLVGARPFRRAPNTGFFNVSYIGAKLTAGLQGALAGRSDDSTYLDGFDLNFDNTLVLPNHDLDFGYAKLDLNATYAVKPRAALFTQLENLLNNQHIGPIGYPSLPFTFRAGVKVRLGGD